MARRWLRTVFEPALERVAAAMPDAPDPVQSYCDLLEVRWLLSERAGRDVGDGPALEALASGGAPSGSAAQMAVAEVTGRGASLLATEWSASSGDDEDDEDL